MKILYLSDSNLSYTVQMANSMVDHCEVSVMFPYKDRIPNNTKSLHSGRDDSSNFYQTLESEVKLEWYKWHDRHLSPINILNLAEIIRKIKKLNPDIIHTQNGGPVWFFLAYRFLSNFRIVSTVHDPIHHLGERKYWKEIICYLLYNKRYVKYFFVNGINLQKPLSKIYKIPMNKIIPIQRGDYSIYLKWNKDKVREEKNTVLFFGRILKYKGLEVLIKAEPIIARNIPDFKIIVAGSGPDIDKYKNMIRSNSSFEFHTEWIPNDKIMDLFKKSKITILPYIDASQSGVIPLSFSFVRPVIATDVGALSEMVDDGKTGFVIPPNSEKHLSLSIIRLLKDNKLRENMKNNIRTSLKGDIMNWKSASRKTFEIYNKIHEK